MVDYRKFDHIGDDDSDIEDHVATANPVSRNYPHELLTPTSTSIPKPTDPNAPPPPMKMVTKGKEGRYRFEYQGRLIYEWEQNLNEVIIYIEQPPNVNRKMLEVNITPNHLTVGIKGTDPYIDEDTGGMVIVKESMWMIDEGEIIINLQKMAKAEAWDCALKGRTGETIDPLTKEEVKKKILLERFQEEVKLL
jgi:hypothetical protein